MGFALLRFRPRYLLSVCAIIAVMGTQALAAIPPAERAVLLNIYASTDGPGWTIRTNWNGPPGTECTWFGVTCDPGAAHVQFIQLQSNNLTGSIPSLAGLPSLQGFLVNNDPKFPDSANRLTGPIPALTGLRSLRFFSADDNQLSGSIPSLVGLSNLNTFAARNNRLTGPIPALAGLTNLRYFGVEDNQLTGPIPSLAGLLSLEALVVSGNQLSGSIPSLSGLSNLRTLIVSGNQLTGSAPAVPSPNGLRAGGSQLCPNHLDGTADPSWDVATGASPWYTNCTASATTFSGATATGSGTAAASTVCSGTPRCYFASAAWTAAPGSPGAPPVGGTIAGVSFPHGLLEFAIVGTTPGFTATLTLTFPQALPVGTVYYKFGPTAGNPVPHWYQIPAVVSGNTVRFSITDGALGDDDLSANGTLVDQGGPASHLATVVEYYHEAFDHYFITNRPDEIAKLDNGTFVGWARTGLTFNAYPRASAGGASVCRFFSTAFAPKSSHFYSPFPTDCATLRASPDWQFEAEGDQAFYMPVGASGSCVAGTAPIYRLYNDGQGGAPNHRYTTDSNARALMISKGWVIEGIGPGFAFMCSPQQ